MGRGKSKGKKVSVTNQDDPGSGEEEKVPVQKRRGRPQKTLKDEIDEDEAQQIEDEDNEETARVPNKDTKSKTVTQNGKKRKRNGQFMEKVDSTKEENGNETKSSTAEELKNTNSFRPNRNRRKNTPHRAAEAVVECN